MQRSPLSLIPAATLVTIATLSTLGLTAPRPAIANPNARVNIQRVQPTSNVRMPAQNSQTAQPRTDPHQFQAPNQTSEAQCGPSTCTCDGIEDCDALFTSTLCAPGTATTTEDDHGQCERND